jgi:citrate synthase
MSQDTSAAARAANASVSFIDNTSGNEASFPLIGGTDGPKVIDIRKLYAETGYFTYDPGFVSTASCESKITFIDGDEGILMHRGYMIEDLAENCDFLEVCYLLLYGELPSPDQKTKFVNGITYHTMLHEQLHNFYRGFRRDAHPMAIMCGVVGALSAFYHDSTDIADPHQRMVASYRLVAKMPTIAAWAYKYSLGQPFMYPRNDLTYSEDFIRMMFATPCEEYEVDPVVEKVLDLLLILHADHEQNCSTSTVRLVGSSMVNLFASVSAGINALWGRSHGGANQEVIEMLAEIRDEGITTRQFVERAKAGDDRARLMGFGHRVYKNFDPRMKIIKKACFDVLEKLGVRTKLLEIAVELEEIALKDDYFVERKLYPNVDFYSGVIYNAIGTPANMFTAIFALGRLPGWIAQWVEMHEDPAFKIGRPRQIYTGPTKHDYVPLDQR